MKKVKKVKKVNYVEAKAIVRGRNHHHHELGEDTYLHQEGDIIYVIHKGVKIIALSEHEPGGISVECLYSKGE